MTFTETEQTLSEQPIAAETLTAQQKPLSHSVLESMQSYFDKIGSTFVNNVYEMVLSEVEKPLLEAVMAYTKGNQSKAAIVLGISRGTLRKKLKIYDMLD
jgi:Fis family transcriptional regulator